MSVFHHKDGTARIIDRDFLSKEKVNIYGFCMFPLFFAPPVTFQLNSQDYSKPLGEREFTWRGTQEDGSTFLEFSETEKNSWFCPGFEPQPPTTCVTGECFILTITPCPLD